MAIKSQIRSAARERRKMHIRKNVQGTAERPRLIVRRSIKHIAASLVDDTKGITLTGVTDTAIKEGQYSLPEKPEEFKEGGKKLPLKGKIAKSYLLGLAIAEVAKKRGINSVVFDRNGLRYHGRVRAVAVGARKGGLEF